MLPLRSYGAQKPNTQSGAINIWLLRSLANDAGPGLLRFQPIADAHQPKLCGSFGLPLANHYLRAFGADRLQLGRNFDVKRVRFGFSENFEAAADRTILI